MSKFYSAEQCRRKADQQWEAADIASRAQDPRDARFRTAEARVWERRAAAGGWEAAPPKKYFQNKPK